MKINVYYGGRGLLDDPTLYVLKKMEDDNGSRDGCKGQAQCS